MLWTEVVKWNKLSPNNIWSYQDTKQSFIDKTIIANINWSSDCVFNKSIHVTYPNVYWKWTFMKGGFIAGLLY